MAPTPFSQIRQHVIQKLQTGLASHLTYHCIAHTLDVLEQAEAIALAEKFKAPKELLLLKVAVLYHDAGFVKTYQNHEEMSREIARQELPMFGFPPRDIETIGHLIMATKLPQSPQTKLEQVICDADLDYLGRDDYAPIADRLYRELLSLGILQTEEQWIQMQINFLEKHHYFTKYCQQNRESRKQANLQELKVKTSQLQKTGA
ncbi:HD domain-containing protein [Rufibacter roseolus]|uniref:HD domain-containing protein n=1 Tax=Rufibacter roseolus TaxID=2817375 RepID=UPI001B3146E3|nr:HD domain-containing protein [Rufibacter roseolus]